MVYSVGFLLIYKFGKTNKLFMMKKITLSIITLMSAFCMQAQITNPAPYCVATFDDEVMNVPDHINGVTFGTLNNASNAQYAAPHYVFYNNLAVPSFNTGSSYNITVNMEVDGGAGYGVWIDYNHNNVFDSNEKVAGSTATDWLNISSNTIKTSSVTIPTTALTGNTRMRVRIVEDDNYTATNGANIAACNASTSATDTMDWGETEDYVINIASLGTNEFEKNTFKLYPNPVTNTLFISNEEAIAINQVIVVNELGQTVLEVNAKFDAGINVSELTNGIYFVQIKGAEDKIATIKFVKQ